MLRFLVCTPCCRVKPQRPKSRSTPSSISQKATKTGFNGLKFEATNEVNKSGTIGTNPGELLPSELGYTTEADEASYQQISPGTTERVIQIRYLDSMRDATQLSPMTNLETDESLEQRKLVARLSGGIHPEPLDRSIHISRESTRNPSQSLESRAVITITSMSRIGDYARLEYSPVDDTESDGTKLSRGSNDELDHCRIGPNEPSKALEVPSRFSSPGIESSISIASQLSNDYLDHNLTNVLESAQTLPAQIHETIGLPLGPLYADSDPGKTSPETTGAALTNTESISQGSPSDNESSRRISDQDSSTKSSVGAALVGLNSSGKVNELENTEQSTKHEQKGLFSAFGKRTKKSGKGQSSSQVGLKGISNLQSSSLERSGTSSPAVVSANDIIIPNSPTPSGASKSSVSKKMKNLAKGLFKKKKKKKDESVADNKDDTSSESGSDKPGK